jgi:hypothetical protein
MTSKKNGSFACIPARVVGIDLHSYDFRVLVEIARHADKEGRANPSLSLIASATGIARRNVSRSIASLEKAGLMRHWQQKGAAGGWAHSVYEIIFDPLQEVEIKPKQQRDEAHGIAAQMLEIWKEECGDVLQVPVKLNRDRITACQARLRDSFSGDLAQWRALCQEIKASAFCCGGGNRGWKADFDWALKPKSILNLIEGKYRDNQSSLRRRAAGSGPVGFEDYEILPLGPGGT